LKALVKSAVSRCSEATHPGRFGPHPGVTYVRILVIEDQRITRGLFIEQSMRTEGHAVIVCHDRESARRLH
jgi:hypothetical protein